jgi:Outer membrane lipoprotein-sorting protein
MKMLTFAAGLVSAGLLGGPSVVAQTPEERGLSIAVETDARDAGFENWVASAKMVLRDKQGGEAVRTFRMMTLEQKEDGDRTLVVFDKPADLAGAAVLTYSHALVPDDQWLYLPEVRRVKRISAQNKAALFMGSEFAYEDLSSFEVKKYKYRYLRDETLDGQDCFVVENTPAYADSAYAKQIEWVDKKLYHPRRLDYFDRQGRLLKTMTFTGYQQYLGKHWRASEQLMQNHQSGKATQVIWGPYKFKTNLHESEFTPEALTRSR